MERILMKRTIFAMLFIISLLVEGSNPTTEKFLIFNKGIPQAAIIMPEAEYSGMIKAFNRYLELVYGKPLPLVVSGNASADRQKIIFKITRTSVLEDNDKFKIEFPDPRTMRITCTNVSLQWALNYLLEEYAGIRWLFPEECGLSHSRKTEMAIPQIPIVQNPSFPLRRYVERTHPSWSPKGRFKNTLDMNHLLLKYVFPAERYEKEGWPQEIMPVMKGKKIKSPPKEHLNGRWQPCYSNPESVRKAVENICMYLEKHPEQKSISLIQNDVGGFCECENCIQANGGEKYEKSEVYFRWVNNVAEMVSQKFPDIIFTAGAYVETQMPPSFKLHKNIIVILTLDLYQCVVPEIMEKQKKYIASWKKKADTLGIWDYSWGHGYTMPRVYFHVHAEMLKYLHEHDTLVYFGENECFDAKEGPKEYLVSKLLWNIDANVDALLDDWYQKCVGKNAAPFLKEYYALWEKIMSGPEIRKTPWFQTAYSSVYMTWDNDRSHMYAVSAADLKSAENLMKQVIVNSQTSQEKERAKLLYRHFEYMATILKLYAAEYLSPENILKDAETAASMLRSFERIPELIRKRNELAAEFKKDSVMGPYYRSKIYNRRLRFEEPASKIMLWLLPFIFDYADAPLVKEELIKLTKNKNLQTDPLTRSVMEALIKTNEEDVNIFPNGNMEMPIDADILWLHPSCQKKGSGIRTSETSFSGQFSWKILPGRYSLIRFHLSAQPNSRYLLSFRIYSEDTTDDADICYGIFPARNTYNQSWYMLPHKKIRKKWQKCLTFLQTRPASNGINGYIFLNKFSDGKAVFIDDLKLIKLK